MVGVPKRDIRGRPMKGVTAVTVRDVLPMQQAELMKMSIVVNDDDLNKATMESGNLNNGQLIHLEKDKNGEMMHSFYYRQADETIKDQVKSFMVGKKRTAQEAGFSE